jgi:hypothetical protein
MQAQHCHYMRLSIEMPEIESNLLGVQERLPKPIEGGAWSHR